MLTIQCPHCGKQFTSQVNAQQVQCPFCGNVVNTGAYQQPYQQPGYQQPGYQQAYQQPGYQQQAYQPFGQQPGVFDAGPSGKSRGVAALLAILLGGLGIHYFYLNKPMAGVIMIVITFVLCGIPALLAVIQGVMMLSMTQQDFENKYVYTTNSFPLF